ncbi:hypothetical protein KJ641_04150 [Patescibacteria group bacterium]|nr:hypothetical protein [Patescibacteria group bacterium]MBU1896032.1 hypothetical protein [Patescibacteria group bacterium]
MKKIILIFGILILTGGGCANSDLDKTKITKIDMQSFFTEYCDIYVNNYQSRDLESYGIEITNDMGVGYYNDVDECVQEMLKIDQSSENACEQYGKSSGVYCDEAMQIRQETYKKSMTKDGCIENGKNNRCALFDTSQPQWSGADAVEISSANAKYAECLQKVEYACSEIPKSW